MRTAVILAARLEKDSDIPFPLLPVSNNQCLLDRTIGMLRDFKISNILIVVGYKSDLFKKYESKDVKVVINPNYEFTASMGSLAMVKDLVHEDFLLIESDTFFERKVLESLTKVPYENCFSITEESGSGDECFVETKNGFVTKITKDRHSVCHLEGEMIGVTKLSLNTFKKMIDIWEKSSNPYLNYEYLLMDVTDAIERPSIKFRNLIWGDVDCIEDFKKLKNDVAPNLRRREDPFDHENLLVHLQTIFNETDVSSAEIVKIGGMSNKNFLVCYKGNRYVLRVPGNGSEGMVVRSHEEFNAFIASNLGVNPQVRYFSSKTGVKLVDYVEDAETLNAATIQRHDNMLKVVDIYKKVHNARVRLKNEFNIFHEIEKYDILMKNVGAVMYSGWEPVRSKVIALENILNEFGVVLCPCHNDPYYENFIKAPNGTLYLIDWEYSGMNDAMADFAALFLEAGFSTENEDFILENYFDGKIPENAKLKILCYQILWDYLWAQWTVIKEAKGDDFGSYGLDRFNRSIENLKKFQSIYGN